MNTEIKEIISLIPDSPGVYLMKNDRGEIIYIGKAKYLKKRVSSYFTRNKDLKTTALVEHIHTIEHICTRNEFEALVLENNLIKQWTPKYNINLKDGKTYPALKITSDKFPRVFRTRKIIDDKAEYFGPYPQVDLVDRYIDLVNKYFHLRRCKGPLKKRNAPCLYYHMGRCFAPCVGKISEENYSREVDQVRRLFQGKTKELRADLKNMMTEASGKLEFEKAAWFRDLLEAIETVNRKQEVQDFNPEGRDYLAWHMEKQFCAFTIFQMRGGKLVGREMFRFKSYSRPDEIILDFFIQYYDADRNIPETVYISENFKLEMVEKYFVEKHKKNIKILVPQRGRHKSIMNMVAHNALVEVEKQLKKAENIPGMTELMEVLNLKGLPKRIEGFDIAQLNGKYPVSSLVSFYNGNPDKKNYRKYHIKTLEGAIDDYGAVREAVTRRYTRVLNDNLERPDLILIDGGKGQLNAAHSILTALGLDNIPVIGLAKKNEEIFTVGSSNPLVLPDTSEALKLLQHVRDETHRFATGFNQKLRERDGKLSFLQEIPGIGPVRSKKLMQKYGSLNNILNADASAIAKYLNADDDLGVMVKEQVEEYLGR